MAILGKAPGSSPGGIRKSCVHWVLTDPALGYMLQAVGRQGLWLAKYLGLKQFRLEEMFNNARICIQREIDKSPYP